MFSCTDASLVLHEVNESCKAYRQCYVRLSVFDFVKPLQAMFFWDQKPASTAAASPSVSCCAMASTSGEKDMKVWGPINNKRATRP